MKITFNSKKDKEEAWDFAFGLIKVDDLKPSLLLKELAKMEIEGKITSKEILDLLLKKYRVNV